MDAGNSFLVLTGKITGSTDVYLSNALGGTTGAFIYNSTCTGSSYTGNTHIQGVSGTPVVVAFWNDQPFGAGPAGDPKTTQHRAATRSVNP